jgi:hypothetical protein
VLVHLVDAPSTILVLPRHAIMRLNAGGQDVGRHAEFHAERGEGRGGALECAAPLDGTPAWLPSAR